MGWISTYVGYNRDRKELITELFDSYCDIKRIEVKGSNVWTITSNKNTNETYFTLFLTSYKDGEFAYKDISVESSPYYYNCSKKYYETVKEYYKNADKKYYVEEWLKSWEEVNAAKKEKSNLIKSLKVGDIIEFKNANYANKKQWRISNICNNKVYFEGFILKGWKKYDFIKI